VKTTRSISASAAVCPNDGYLPPWQRVSSIPLVPRVRKAILYWRAPKLREKFFHDKATYRFFRDQGVAGHPCSPRGRWHSRLGAEARHERLDIIYSPEQTSGDILGSTLAQSISAVVPQGPCSPS
jgi:hypothetical protein